jgi:hypothetical protein
MTTIPPLPGRTLRIGVTGTRKLDAAQLYFLRPKVVDLLRSVADAATVACGARPRLQILSPLAEGADRFVAECALAEGFELVCPLPFPQTVYEEDFGVTDGSLPEFRHLLARAGGRVLALDGARDDPKRGIYAEARSYEAVGRLIVRNSDLIIGIWNGLPGEGRGGTADTIHYAASFGPPAIWLHATNGMAEPCWIEEAHDLRFGAPLRTVDEPLRIYLGRLLPEPKAVDPTHDQGWLHRLGHAFDAVEEHWRRLMKRPRPATPLAAFAGEQPMGTCRLWNLHGDFMGYMAGGKPARGEDRAPPADPVARRWFDDYKPATALSAGYAKRYRSGYVLAFLLAAFALSFAALSLAFGHWIAGKIVATGLEFLVLAAIALLVVFNDRARWHTKAIDYRLLAELCRKQQTLAPLAWAVPRASAWANTESESAHDPKTTGSPLGSVSWVAWLFSARLRDAPLPSGTIDADWVTREKASALHDLLDEQIKYHTDRQTLSYRAAERLKAWGERAFWIVVGLVLIKLALLFLVDGDEAVNHATLVGLGLLGAVLPAASAAFVGIRAYAELEMLADQSASMVKALKHARRQIAELDPAAPLASQALGYALAAVALLMLEDLDGWARLFRGKVLDA